MMQRWSVGDSPLFHVGQAVISAAVDCRRAAYPEPLSDGYWPPRTATTCPLCGATARTSHRPRRG
ncbi:MAG: hypothetical protein QOI78_9526 [Actinomycetota bacterium]|nr:hypothetical protein [Actinomycetota bacterium]